jgi:hypothetical protein
MSAKELLRSQDISQSLPRVIEWVGQATGVDRVHLFEIDLAAPPDQGRIRTHYKWCASGVPTPPEFDNAKAAPWLRWALAHWCPGSRAAKQWSATSETSKMQYAGSLKSVASNPPRRTHLCRRPLVGSHRFRQLQARMRMVDL